MRNIKSKLKVKKIENEPEIIKVKSRSTTIMTPILKNIADYKPLVSE